MVAHGFELANSVVSRFLRVELGEVVAAGIVVGGVGRGDVRDRDEQCALNLTFITFANRPCCRALTCGFDVLRVRICALGGPS